MVDRCLEEGINFFDTANVHNKGVSEVLFGARRAAPAGGSGNQGV